MMNAAPTPAMVKTVVKRKTNAAATININIIVLLHGAVLCLLPHAG
jgi:hypothetical protein